MFKKTRLTIVKERGRAIVKEVPPRKKTSRRINETHKTNKTETYFVSAGFTNAEKTALKKELYERKIRTNKEITIYEKALSSNKLSSPIGIDELFSTNGTIPSIDHQTNKSKTLFAMGNLFLLKTPVFGTLNSKIPKAESNTKREKTFGSH